MSGTRRVLNPHEFELAKHYETGAALLVSETGDRTKAFWLPKSQIDWEETGKRTSEEGNPRGQFFVPIIKADVPEWLAEEKGLV